MKYYMCTFNKDWADELDVVGSKVFTEDEKLNFEAALIEHADVEVTIYFGTNEGWDEPVSDFIPSYNFKEISETMYSEVKENFGGEFGTFIDVIESALGEQEQDEDEDW